MVAKAAPAVGYWRASVVRAARLARTLAAGSEESAMSVSIRLCLAPGVLATRHNLAPVARLTLVRRQEVVAFWDRAVSEQTLRLWAVVVQVEVETVVPTTLSRSQAARLAPAV
jgi:hypothetical protein